MSDEIPLPPDEPPLPRRAPRPRWQSIGLAVGAILLGVAVVGGGALIAGGLNLSGTASPGPSVLPSAGGSSSVRPSMSASPSSTPPTSTPTGSPRPLNSAFSILPAQPPTEMPSITCSGSIGASDPVALVFLRQSDPSVAAPLVLRDYADLANPRTACTFPTSQPVQLIDARHVVVGGAGPALFAVVDLPEVRYQWFQLPSSETVGSEFIAVSPGLDEIAWMKGGPYSATGDLTNREIHITTAAGDTVVAGLPDEPTGFCGAPPDSSKRGAFSRSGEYLYVLDQPLHIQEAEGGGAVAETSQYSLRVFAGTKLVYSVIPPSGGWPAGEHPAYPVWSPTSDTLYYRQGDVWRWVPGEGASRLFYAGPGWINATIAPDGRHVAYAVHGDTVDVPTTALVADWPVFGHYVSVGSVIAGPVFLNNSQLWLITQAVDHGCAGTENPRPVIYNIADHSTASSIIEDVRLVWPATSSSY